MVYTDIHLPLTNVPRKTVGFIALDWCLMIFALIIILLRYVVRHRRAPHAQTSPKPSASLASYLSDIFVLASWISGMALIAINTWKNKLRYKYHRTNPDKLYYGVPHDMAAHLLYVSWISLFPIYISLYFSKAAFVAFYYDLFSNHSKKMQIMLLVTSIFTFLTFLVQIMLLAFWCQPTNLNWNVDGHLCSAVHDIKSVTISTFTNVGTDLLILAVPTMVFTSLSHSLNKREIYGLIFVCVIGSISITAALARFVVLKLVEHAPRAEVTHTIDVWALVEIVASLIAVSLPALRVLLRSKDSGSGRTPSDGPETRSSSIGSGRKLSVPKDESEVDRMNPETTDLRLSAIP
ncbi:hypothetical protein GP486_002844 [Trichoglossum hirsutum]|uniref:Rhodopsin domain-containing protein n=1 Tax=Trichoglossum hirsutum TaxID=265104 RepID=A0A9P8LEA9_9PEZI|nr:hypothetical protein GP486_002844 [Trichoglossum hirsutum]